MNEANAYAAINADIDAKVAAYKQRQANATEHSNEAADEIGARLAAEKRADAGARETGLKALRTIEGAVNRHPDTGQSHVLVRYLLCLYDGGSYPFNLRDLRRLDTQLAHACCNVLELDTRAVADIEEHLAGGKQWLLAQRDLHGIARIEDDL